MRKVCLSGVAACAVLLLAGQTMAQVEYALGFDGPASAAGSADAVVSQSYTCTLTHAGEGVGAQGWSIGCTAEGGLITSATTDGTTAAEVFNGGFNKTVLALPENNGGTAGAVSAVVLCFGCPAVLPPNDTSSMLAIGVDWVIPVGGGLGAVRYVDGLVGDGQAVAVVVTENGASVPHDRNDLEVTLVEVQSCCEAEYRLGFSADSVANEVPGEGMLDDDPETCPGVGAVEIDEQDTLYAVVASNAVDGVQGWSIGVAVSGDIAVTDVTTDGTLAAPEPDGIFNGGFNKTGLALPENNGGGSGAVSAVVLCFGCGATLSTVGTSAILALSVEGAQAASGELKYVDGLIGEGQPVANVLTVNGASAEICNLATAGAIVSVREGPAMLGPFLRGDPNDDGKTNIADPIWIINELFRGGQETGCQAAADANGDDNIDLADATFLISYQFLGGDAPTAPFPDCGQIIDPENDIVSCDTIPSACQ